MWLFDPPFVVADVVTAALLMLTELLYLKLLEGLGLRRLLLLLAAAVVALAKTTTAVALWEL